MFKLGAKEFKTEQALLYGGFCDGAMNERMQCGNSPSFTWHIEIQMDEQPFDCGNEDMQDEIDLDFEYAAPRLYHNNGFILNIKSWKDIEGISLKWDHTHNENGEEAGYLYVFEHEDVTSGKIEFLKRRKNIFLVRWSGTANVYWDNEFGEDVPFLFEDDVIFTGFTTHCDEIFSLDSLKTFLNSYVDLDEYVLLKEETHETQTVSGITYSCSFAPCV